MVVTGLQMTLQSELKQAAELHRSGAYDGALALYKKLLSQFPKNFEILNLAALSELASGNSINAKRYALKSVRLTPINGMAHNILGAIAVKKSQYGEAISSFQKAVKSSPNSAECHLNLAVTLNSISRADEALAPAQRAASLYGNNAFATFTVAKTLEALGRRAEACEMYRKVVALDSMHVDAWVGILSNCGLKEGEGTEHIQSVLDSVTDNERKARLHFALAAMLEKRDDFKMAFHHLKTGNELYRSTFEYDVAQDEHLFKVIAETFTREKMNGLSLGHKSTQAPIFIVGMPRSGSTLIEQILSGHSKVVGGGEMPVLPKIVSDELWHVKRHSPKLPNGGRQKIWLVSLSATLMMSRFIQSRARSLRIRTSSISNISA